jgi:hypothetical protein
VINRPGVLSPRQTVELYNNCRSFLSQANQMCRSVWIDFNLQVQTRRLLLCQSSGSGSGRNPNVLPFADPDLDPDTKYAEYKKFIKTQYEIVELISFIEHFFHLHDVKMKL